MHVKGRNRYPETWKNIFKNVRLEGGAQQQLGASDATRSPKRLRSWRAEARRKFEVDDR